MRTKLSPDHIILVRDEDQMERTVTECLKYGIRRIHQIKKHIVLNCEFPVGIYLKTGLSSSECVIENPVTYTIEF